MLNLEFSAIECNNDLSFLAGELLKYFLHLYGCICASTSSLMLTAVLHCIPSWSIVIATFSSSGIRSILFIYLMQCVDSANPPIYVIYVLQVFLQPNCIGSCDCPINLVIFVS